MIDLGEGDAAVALQAAHDIFEIGQDEDFTTAVLEIIHAVIPCEIISYNELNLATGVTHTAIFPSEWMLIASESMPVFKEAVRDHPIVIHMAETGLRSAVRLEDVIDDRDLFKTAFYTDFLSGLLGLRHQLAIGLPSPSWLVFGLALSRGPGYRFTSREVSLLNALGPPIVHGYQRSAARQSHIALQRSAADAGWAVVSVAENGIVTQIDGDPGPAFEFGQQVPTDVLRLMSEPHQDALLSTNPTTVAALLGDTSLRVHQSPSAGYLLLVRPNGKDLRTSLIDSGFTRRQADVAEQLLIGGTNDNIARRLAISTGTVRKHLEALYRGLGVHDRSSAVAQIAGHARNAGAI